MVPAMASLRWLLTVLALTTLVAGCGGEADGGGDGGDAGAEIDGGAEGDAAPPPERTRYPAGAAHSPLTATVASRLQAVLAGSTQRRDVFAKIGDSITVDPNFVGCFARDGETDLGASAALEPTRQYFKKTLADATATSFDRVSLAATVGWSSSDALAGAPNAVDREITAATPGLAVVMFGTNETAETGVHPFEKNLGSITDMLLGRGVIPILSTIPPRGDSAVADALVVEMNAVVRAVAESRQVPYMDLWQRLTPLGAGGLAGDGVHLSVYVQGGVRGCILTDAGLMKGVNQRNRITLEALDRVRRFVVDGAAPEPEPPALRGSGTWDDPIIVDRVPFVDSGTTSGAESRFATYACGAQNEGGPERVYKITLGAPTMLRARVYVDTGVDTDLHWLDGPRADACVGRADKTLDVSTGAGEHWLAVDSFVSAGVPRAGGYRLTLVRTGGGI